MDMNPNNIRRTYTSSSKFKKRYRYDPIKNAEGRNVTTTTTDGDESGVADVDEAQVAQEETTLDVDDDESQPKTAELDNLDDDDDDDDDDLKEEESSEYTTTIDNAEYERNAPWNQYAWLEELHLRINGMVPFGAPIQRAHVLSQWIHGRIYSQSVVVPASSSSRGGGNTWVSWLWWPLLWTGSHSAIGSSQRYRASWDGVDGDGEQPLYGSSDVKGKGGWFKLPWLSKKTRPTLNRASNKP